MFESPTEENEATPVDLRIPRGDFEAELNSHAVTDRDRMFDLLAFKEKRPVFGEELNRRGPLCSWRIAPPMSTHVQVNHATEFLKVRFEISPDKTIAADPIEEENIDGAVPCHLVKKLRPICASEPNASFLKVTHFLFSQRKVTEPGSPLMRSIICCCGSVAGKESQ